MLTGYMHPGYAESLKEFGIPRELPSCGGWILKRPIPGFPYHDAMGCYPLFACQDWSQLHADLEDLGQELITLSLVTDPFGAFELTHLQRCFDVVTPFKEHFIVDLSRPIYDFVSRDHRDAAQKAFRRGIHVEKVQDPMQFAEDWITLYATLIKKYSIKGIKAFSRAAFVRQLSIPGLVMLRAAQQGITVGFHLVFVQGEVGYNFLGAYSDAGYKLRASCALYLYSIEYFANQLRWLDLGGGAGVNNDATDGLSQFKMGWSTGNRTAYFCGRIFDPERYAEIVKAKGIAATDYFPAYRKGEFA
jgi:hypothetical protein